MARLGGLVNELFGSAEFKIGNILFDDRRSREWQHRYGAIGIVLLLHFAGFWAVSLGMKFQPPPELSHEFQVTFVSPNYATKEAAAPPLDWEFQEPPQIAVPEPEISIAPAQMGPNGIAAGTIHQRLAPHLDPDHVNDSPQLPRSAGPVLLSSSLRLRVLVLPDGTVGDAQVVKSSGEGDVDQLAVNYVKNFWQFIPGSLDGNPVEAWTTVIVRFAPM